MTGFKNNLEGERRSQSPLKDLHPAVFILITLISVFVFYQIIGGFLSLSIFGEDIKSLDINKTKLRFLIAFSQYMFILIPVIVLNILRGDNPTEIFILRKPDFNVLIIGLVGIIIIQPALQLYLYIQSKILFNLPIGADLISKLKDLMDSLDAAMLNLVKADSIPEFLFVVFIVAVTPAICEEFMFRGLILSNFKKIVPSGAAILMSGLLFAVFHFHPFNLIPLIVIGFYLSFTAFYSGSIVTPIILHFTFNFVSSLMVFIFGKDNFDDPSIPLKENINFIIIGFVSIILFIMTLVAIKNYYYKNLKDKPKDEQSK